MINVRIDAQALIRTLSDAELRQVPYALSETMIGAAFDVREAWRKEMLVVFDRPTRWTTESVLIRSPGYDRINRAAVRKTFELEVFLRDEAGDHVAPAKYLQFQVRGGVRRPKRSEVLLRQRGVLGPNEFLVPARGFPLDPFGNVPGSVMQTILSDLQASFDPAQHSTRESRGRRSRRRELTKRRIYFTPRPRDNRPLPRGIYARARTGFGWSLDMVLAIVRAPFYSPIYDVFSIAERTFWESFARRWPRTLARAMRTRRR